MTQGTTGTQAYVGDKPYTVADLMEKVVNQDKLLNAGGTKKKATDLLAGHGLRPPSFKSRNGKKGKQKKRCAAKDCKNVVKVHFHKFCERECVVYWYSI